MRLLIIAKSMIKQKKKMENTKSIFREYDIRGIYPEEINESIVSLIAKAH